MKKFKVLLLTVSLMFFFGGGINTLNADGCNTGGPGSSSCTDGGSMGFLGFSFGYESSVSCEEGYYACCNGDSATCKKVEKEKEKLTEE